MLVGMYFGGGAWGMKYVDVDLYLLAPQTCLNTKSKHYKNACSLADEEGGYDVKESLRNKQNTKSKRLRGGYVCKSRCCIKYVYKYVYLY